MAAEQSGQLEIKINTEAYLRDGSFDQDHMLETFEQLASGNAPGGFPLSRIVCRMDWVVGDRARLENVIEFESRVNDAWSRHDDAVICTYHLSQFKGDAIIDILRTHPLVIIDGLLQQNPFFTPPREFLREYRERRSASGSLPQLPTISPPSSPICGPFRSEQFCAQVRERAEFTPTERSG